MPELLAPNLPCFSDSTFQNCPSSQSPSSEAQSCPQTPSRISSIPLGVEEGGALCQIIQEREETKCPCP